MHKKILEDLLSVNPSELVKTKKVLAKIYGEICFMLKVKNFVAIQQIANTLSYFLSINSKQNYYDSSIMYRSRRFLDEVRHLVQFCLKVVG